MKFSTYNAMRPGMAQALKSALGGEKGGGDEYGMVKALAAIDKAKSGVAKDQASTALLNDMLKNRGLLSGMADINSPEAVRAATLAGRNPNAFEMEQGVGQTYNNHLNQAREEAIRNGASPDVINALTMAANGKAYTPFKESGGYVVNQGTGGAQQLGTATAQIAERNAAADASHAAAGEHTAAAGLSNEKTHHLVDERGLHFSGNTAFRVNPGDPPADPNAIVPTQGGLTQALAAATGTPPAGPSVSVAASAPQRPSKEDTKLTLSKWLENTFKVPVTGPDGKPQINPISGAPAWTVDDAKRDRFLSYLDQNQGKFKSPDEAFVAWQNSPDSKPPPALPPAAPEASGGILSGLANLAKRYLGGDAASAPAGPPAVAPAPAGVPQQAAPNVFNYVPNKGLIPVQ